MELNSPCFSIVLSNQRYGKRGRKEREEDEGGGSQVREGGLERGIEDDVGEKKDRKLRKKRGI